MVNEIQTTTTYNQIRDEALHNLLMALYIKKQPEKIIPYLTESDSNTILDVKYVLKQCLEAGLQEQGYSRNLPRKTRNVCILKSML